MSIAKIFVGLTLLVITLACGSEVYAEVSSKGLGNIKYSGWGKPDGKDKERTFVLAKKSALQRWVSKQGTSFSRNFDAVKDRAYTDLDSYILGFSVLSEEYNKDTKNYSVVIKVQLDDTALKNLVSSSSSVASASEDERSYLTFVFVSRRQTSVQSFAEKVYKRADTTTSEDGIEQEAASATGVEYVAENNRSESSTRGGSTTRKADKIQYDVANAAEINVAMSNVFSEAGFEVVEAEYLEEESEGLLTVDNFIEDYRYGDDISSQTKKNAAKGARLVEVPYMAVGTLDIGMKDTDPTSGMIRVHVTVTGKIISVKKRFPKTIASIGPVQFAGVGSDQSVAERNALKLASASAATELVNQLNAKGIY